MDLQMTTPALIFPAISLIMLAYTNRFLGVSTVIRNLTHEYQQHPDDSLLLQIDNLQRRVIMVRNMQMFGVACIMLSIASIIALFFESQFWGVSLFTISLSCLVVSLLISMYELILSCHALEIALGDMEKDLKQIAHPILARPRRRTKSKKTVVSEMVRKEEESNDNMR
ncbi:hypothetical protein ADP71_08640 [Vitreoscilla sp. C1]|nr:hypothetical protein ADP71_08640 [Vitreoscilla sp. C1]